MEIRYQVEKRDAITQMRKMTLRRNHQIMLLLVSLIGAGLMFVPGIFLVGFIILIFPPLFIWFFWRAIDSLIAQHPEILEEQTLQFDDAGLRIINSVLNVHWPWSRIKAIDDSGAYWLVRTDQFGSGAVIPKSALTPNQERQFLAHAKNA